MKKENLATATRITRAQASNSQLSGGIPPFEVSKQHDKTRITRAMSKRQALDERNTSVTASSCVQRKRRAVLKDVTNVCCDNSYRSCLNAAKIPKKNVKMLKRGSMGVSKVAPSVAVTMGEHPTNTETNMSQQSGKTEHRSVEIISSAKLDKELLFQPSVDDAEGDCSIVNHQFDKQQFGIPLQNQSFSKKEKTIIDGKSVISKNQDFIDIDRDEKDPQLCSLYASDIYSNLLVAELMRKPHPDFMETVQQDITPSMRSILVDWLVEVAEEYMLVPDTLYLTVHLIDLFLSRNYIERQRLQLLGITCMLIASKYEEICAPRIEEFCFITDNTYTRAEVLTMESQVLNYLGFQLSAPTAKSFLRRFLRVAQASYKSPSFELEFLANYLAELTLVDYSFLKYLPSIIAASTVFLARWTLDQSGHPWNPTMEHYTSYKASDLKTTVLAIQGLQMNSSNCPLNTIRAKYRQDKYKSVAVLPSPRLTEILF